MILYKRYHSTSALSQHSCAITAPLRYHSTPALSQHPCAITALLRYHSTPVLSLHPCAITAPLCYHCTPVLSQHPCAITAPLRYHCTPALSLHPCAVTAPLHCHSTPALSQHPCAITAPLRYQRVLYKRTYAWFWPILRGCFALQNIKERKAEIQAHASLTSKTRAVLAKCKGQQRPQRTLLIINQEKAATVIRVRRTPAPPQKEWNEAYQTLTTPEYLLLRPRDHCMSTSAHVHTPNKNLPHRSAQPRHPLRAFVHACMCTLPTTIYLTGSHSLGTHCACVCVHARMCTLPTTI